MNDFSKECHQLAQAQIENQMKRMNELWHCRTPQDLAAVQTDMVRETLEGVLESSRRLATMSVKVADEATTHIREKMQRAA